MADISPHVFTPKPVKPPPDFSVDGWAELIHDWYPSLADTLITDLPDYHPAGLCHIRGPDSRVSEAPVDSYMLFGRWEHMLFSEYQTLTGNSFKQWSDNKVARRLMVEAQYVDEMMAEARAEDARREEEEAERDAAAAEYEAEQRMRSMQDM